MPYAKPEAKSLTLICRLLSAEGFTDYTANQVERYWRHCSGLTEHQRKSIAKLEKELSKLCADMDEGQKLVLGRFIGLQKKVSFDTGLRIGLAMLANATGKDMSKAPPSAGWMYGDDSGPQQEQSNEDSQGTA